MSTVVIKYQIIPREFFVKELKEKYKPDIAYVCDGINESLKMVRDHGLFSLSYEIPEGTLNPFVYCEVCLLLKKAGYVFETRQTNMNSVVITIHIGLNQEIVPYEKVTFY